ncbi:S9 family peptidase [Taibaiella koreensis]|uniref:S9 family peptidase n=1 Tax=Taibaiella koreensis TaxID=1268548 RepID=UPI000E59AA86|nr:S9 family peptidase [Taibaiella koreensis]
MHQNQDAPLIPMKDFFRNPEKRSYQLSPDGRHIAFMAPYKSRMNIFVQEMGKPDAIAHRITSQEERDIAGYIWANDSRIVYVKDNDGDENYQLFAVGIDGSNHKALTPFDEVRADLIDDLPEQDDYLIIGLNKRNPEVSDPYRLDINTGALELLYENPGNITDWETDHDGKLLIASTSDGVNTTLLYRPDENEAFQEVLTTNFKETLSPQFFDAQDHNIVYATSNLGRDRLAAVRYDIVNKKEIEVLFEHPEVDVDGIGYSRKRKVATSIFYTGDKTEYHFLDKEAETRRAELRRLIDPDLEFGIVSMNKDEDKFLVVTYDDKTNGSYYYYDRSAQKLSKIADISPWLDRTAMADMKPVRYTARDGVTIYGYLTLPKGEAPKGLPVVVNPHGGPWARDEWGFSPEVQFLANRGYAVLQMNFRGSTGYGRAFMEKAFKQWGQAMQDDITDGVQWLIKEGIADPARVAIYGGSYGGYATLAGITKTPDLYACAIDYVGVSNLFTFMNTIPPYWEPYKKMMYEMVGDPDDAADKVMLHDNSPVFHAANIKCPLFIAQGANDPRVNKDESDQMVAALKGRGIAVDYMVKDNEGHGFNNEENRFDFYRTMETFLARHLGGRMEQ